MPLVPLYDSYRYSMRWMDGDVSIPSPHTRDIHKPSIALLPYLCLYVTSLRLRISRSSGSICLPLCFHPFTTRCSPPSLSLSWFTNRFKRMILLKDTIECLPPAGLQSNAVIMINMLTIISVIKMEMVNWVTNEFMNQIF